MKIQASNNGPLLIAGTARYVGSDGEERSTAGTMVALCRCGGSANKPFCDGTHRRNDFQAPAVELDVTG